MVEERKVIMDLTTDILTKLSERMSLYKVSCSVINIYSYLPRSFFDYKSDETANIVAAPSGYVSPRGV
eukprot:TRINITY_DN10889_c0_g1_i1.p1 TRINITY_DN10889_c0_g1~~TRINITY_DN10889_c0_g1_i1.p1  ORF type:complete len:68 (+),score=2.12 TRINITY_DN10889_c0_g1_i1:152-355(+)